MIKKYFLIFFLSILFPHITYTINQIYDAIINLGGDCQVAYQLSTHGLRTYALPFDSLVTPYNSLQKILENNFEAFMNKNNFELITNDKGEKYILDKKYGTRLLHDFKLEDTFLDNYENIAAKYIRRIERFNHLIKNSQCPLFIRKNITKEQATELNNVLSALREHKPFLLLALDHKEEIKTHWQIENTLNIYLKQPEPYIWKGDSEAWKNIFTALELKITNSFNDTHKSP